LCYILSKKAKHESVFLMQRSTIGNKRLKIIEGEVLYSNN